MLMLISIFQLKENKRDKENYYIMAPQTTKHQLLAFSLARKIADYIDKNKGKCQVLLAPFAVFLNEEKNYVEPDISVICDPDKIDDDGCHGAPDWIIEIVSPESRRMDYMIKLFKYRSAGVREYWIVDPEKNRIIVYNFINDTMMEYSFGEPVKAGIYDDLVIAVE